jgi:hypothetical protein
MKRRERSASKCRQPCFPSPTRWSNKPFAMRQLKVAKCRFGSLSTFTVSWPDVRSSSVSDQTGCLPKYRYRGSRSLRRLRNPIRDRPIGAHSVGHKVGQHNLGPVHRGRSKYGITLIDEI